MIENLITKTQKAVTINLMDIQKLSYDALIILNSQIKEKELEKVFTSAKNVVLADGGANYIFRSKWKNSEKIRVIVGDLDSVEDGVKKFYDEKGVQITKIYDQDYNDLHKAMQWCCKKNYQHVVIFGAFADRIDQTLSALSITSYFYHNHPIMDTIIMGQNNLMILIRPKVQYHITLPKWAKKKGCSMIPFQKAEHIEASGFKWSLGAKSAVRSLNWGQFISTSNQFTAPQVKINSSHELFFSFGIEQS